MRKEREPVNTCFPSAPFTVHGDPLKQPCNHAARINVTLLTCRLTHPPSLVEHRNIILVVYGITQKPPTTAQGHGLVVIIKRHLLASRYPQRPLSSLHFPSACEHCLLVTTLPSAEARARVLGCPSQVSSHSGSSNSVHSSLLYSLRSKSPE